MPTFIRALLILLAALIPLRSFANPATPLFEFIAAQTDEKSVSVSSLQGKLLVVNFWARWCGPCRQEIPDFVALDAKYRSKGIAILGMAVEEPQFRQPVHDFAKSFHADYPVMLTGTSKGIDLMKALGNNKTALPFTVIIDRHGNLLKTKLGAMSKLEMQTAIEAALK